MPEMPDAGEDHGDVFFIRCGNHFIVTDRAARLNHGCGTRIGQCIHAIAEWEEGIGSHR